MAACAALLMATTIRQAAFIRRREIGIMRLVGASNWTIRMPFLTEMVIVSGVGVLLAVGLLVALTNYVFEEGVIQIALSQAFIGVSDVWILAPWMLLGVTADRGGHQPGHPAALPARLRPVRWRFAEDTAAPFCAHCAANQCETCYQW